MLLNMEFSSNLIIQYSIVGILLLGACIWILWKVFSHGKKSKDPCCGCGLADNCKKKNLKSKR